jgi:hypothetical protein
MNAMTVLHPLLAYGFYWGWWWWIVILFFFWWLLLPPFAYGRRWYGSYGARTGAAPGRFNADWQTIESRFIEAPADGLAQADRIVGDLMTRVRPSGLMAREYSSAHAAAVKAQSGDATAEEMRAAMLSFRGLFEQAITTLK